MKLVGEVAAGVIDAAAHEAGPGGIVAGMVKQLRERVAARGHRYPSASVFYRTAGDDGESGVWEVTVVGTMPTLYRRLFDRSFSVAIARMEQYLSDQPPARKP